MLPLVFHTNILCLSNYMLWMLDGAREVPLDFSTSMIGFNVCFGSIPSFKEGCYINSPVLGLL
jgi:hypothetical protein